MLKSKAEVDELEISLGMDSLKEEATPGIDMENNMMMTAGRFGFEGFNAEKKKEVNYDNCNNLHFLFDYLSSKTQLNYTSFGYFAKILNSIFNKRFDDVHFYIDSIHFFLNIYSDLGFLNVHIK